MEPRNQYEAIMDHVAKGEGPDGARRAIRVDAQGYLLPPLSRAGFRAEIGVVAGVGFAAELIPSSGTRLIVHGVFFTKPSVVVTVRLIKNSTASTLGTSTNSTVTPLDSMKPSRSTVVKLFTAVPTAGTSVGDLAEQVVDTTDWFWFPFGVDGEPPLVLHGPNETLAVNTSAVATIAGFINWSEEGE